MTGYCDTNYAPQEFIAGEAPMRHKLTVRIVSSQNNDELHSKLEDGVANDVVDGRATDEVDAPLLPGV